jgi:hypothetical protein
MHVSSQSQGGGLHSIIIKGAIVYLGRREDNWVTEDLEIGFPSSEGVGRHGPPCSYTLFRRTKREIE